MNSTPAMDSVAQVLLDECTELAKYALASGNSVPSLVLQTIADCQANGVDHCPPTSGGISDIQRLADAHSILSQLVAPATPRAITLFAHQRIKYPRLCYFGPIPLVRWLMLIAIVFLTLLIALSATKATNLFDENGNVIDWSIFNSSGSILVIRMLFLLSAAGLGACFAALFRVNKTIVAGNYDPKYSVSYWIRIVLGLIAGVILSEVVPLANTSLRDGAKPILALLGGFSAATLFRILNRLVLAIESIVQGDTQEIVKAQQRVVESLSNQKLIEEQLAIRIANDARLKRVQSKATGSAQDCEPTKAESQDEESAKASPESPGNQSATA